MTNKIKRTVSKTKFGFTLVEALVAISILSLSILSSFTAVQNSLKNSSLSKDQITAFFLAQEAVEFIKNIRDENALKTLGGTPTNWLYGLAESGADPCFTGKICRIDSFLKNVSSCPGASGSCPFLNQAVSSPYTGLFGYTGGWPASRFKREIQFQILGANEVYVTVTITWTQALATQTFQVKQLLYNHE